MVSQLKTAFDPATGVAAPLAAGCAETLGAGGAVRRAAGRGRLQVVAGRVWVTRRGDLQDHVLERGQCLETAAFDAALVEAWRGAALVRWQPLGVGEQLRGVGVAGIGAALGVAAALCARAGAALDRAAAALSALARDASRGASRRCSA